MHRGYVKLWRKSIESEVFADPGLWHLWTACLMMANHKDEWVAVGGVLRPIRVMRGQFVTGRFALHKACYPKKRKTNPSPITLWRWLLALRDMQNLNIEANNKFTLVTINSYSTYNDVPDKDEQVNDQQVISRRSAGDQQVITNKNEKNDKNDKKKEKAIAFSPLEEQLPEPLQTEQFKDAWSSYLKHRKEKKSPLTATAASAAIKKLEGMGHDRAIAALLHTVSQGWTGIFEPKDGATRATRSMPVGPGQVFISEGDKF